MYTGMANDKYNGSYIRSTFHVSPERIVEACTDGRMQDIGEVLDEHNLPSGRREHGRVRAGAR
jgi:hypothetical protein